MSQLPVQLSLSQPEKTLVPSYYGLYSLYNKIRNKVKIVSAGYWGGEGERVGAEWVVREVVGAMGDMTQALYAHMNNKIKHTHTHTHTQNNNL
jgi:hypothetical protein